jgi:hypothetical protein
MAAMTKRLHMSTPCHEAPKRATSRGHWLLFAMLVAYAGASGLFGGNAGGAPLGQLGHALSDAWQRDFFETRELMSRHLVLRPNP